MTDQEYYAVPTGDVDYELHSDEFPFCWDETCPDRENQEEIQEVGQHVVDGLMTVDEADQLYHGRAI
jgi:hypothetical protein